MLTYLWIALGSALGGMARYACSMAAVRWMGAAFPWGTLIVNVAGSFVIGFVIALFGAGTRWEAPADLRLFVTVGFCGGFTTFSTFSSQTLEMLQLGEVGLAAMNVAISVALCLAVVWAGYALGAALGRPQ